MIDTIKPIIGFLFLIAGTVVCIYWQVRLLVVAYRCSLWWLFGCLFVPFADLVFLLFNFKIARKPYALSWLGLIVAGLGGWMAGVTWN